MEIFIKKLFGYSGCELNLLESDTIFFVRKISCSKSYNQRLKKQSKKQENFISKSLFAPKVINSGEKNDLFYFDMQFINSKTLAESLYSTTTTQIASTIRALFAATYHKNRNKNPDANIIFRDKISELKNSINQTENTKKAFSLLDKFDWQKIYQSPCHGDLTLENILITPDKKIFLIDFLDSFYDSWLIDVAKLLQDLELGWSFRNKKNDTNLNLRLMVAKQVLMEEISRLPDSHSLLISIYHLLLLNILRIFPYTKDKQTLEFLNSSLDKIFTIIKDIPTGV